MAGVFANKHHRIEPIWHLQLAMLFAIGLQIALPDRFVFVSHYATPVVEFLLLVSLSFTTPHRHVFRSLARTTNVILLIFLTSIANIYSLITVANRLLQGGTPTNGRELLLVGINIYLTNVIIFALWYYEMDGGGPGKRAEIEKYDQDFLFPQNRHENYKHPDWRPTFIDYLYMSSTNAIAFSPADTVPLSRRAKFLMMIQSTLSLVIVALVAARAVSILQ